MLQLIITYIWFGAVVPEDYLIQLSQVNYPVRLLINPVSNLPYSLDIMKSDRYRLEAIKDGGIYADFDLSINYPCLMGILQNVKGQLIAMRFDEPGWQIKVSNGFLYVPKGNTSLINQILEKEGKNCSNNSDSIAVCNGPMTLQKYRDRITLVDISKCVYHNFDYSWYKDASKEPEKAKPYSYFADKLVKKADIKKHAKQLEKKLNETEAKLGELAKNQENEEKTVNEFKSKEQELKSKAEELEKKLKEAESKAAAQVTAAEKCDKSVNGKLTEAESKLKKAQEENKQLAKKAEELTKSQKEVESKLGELTKQQEAGNKALAELKSKEQELKTAADSADKKLKEAESKAKSGSEQCEKKSKSLNEKLTEAEQKSKKAEDSRKQLSTKLEQLEKGKKEVESKFLENSNTIDKLNKKATQSMNQITKKQQQILLKISECNQQKIRLKNIQGKNQQNHLNKIMMDAIVAEQQNLKNQRDILAYILIGLSIVFLGTLLYFSNRSKKIIKNKNIPPMQI